MDPADYAPVVPFERSFDAQSLSKVLIAVRPMR
jgi:hypothetical protein